MYLVVRMGISDLNLAVIIPVACLNPAVIIPYRGWLRSVLSQFVIVSW